MLRYRTRDLTRPIPGECSCGLPYPRHDRIIGRRRHDQGQGSQHLPRADRRPAFPPFRARAASIRWWSIKSAVRDHMVLRFERENGTDADAWHDLVQRQFKLKIGILIEVEALPPARCPAAKRRRCASSTTGISKRGEAPQLPATYKAGRTACARLPRRIQGNAGHAPPLLLFAGRACGRGASSRSWQNPRNVL